MWRRVALCSKQYLDQLQAYQNAIEALNVSTKIVTGYYKFSSLQYIVTDAVTQIICHCLCTIERVK